MSKKTKIKQNKKPFEKCMGYNPNMHFVNEEMEAGSEVKWFTWGHEDKK